MNRMLNNATGAGLLPALALLLSAAPAIAQPAWPSKPLRLIVPLAHGGPPLHRVARDQVLVAAGGQGHDQP